MINVTFKQLRAFVVLANELNFSKAAARLNVTGPTLTASIKTLEVALEIKLFDRSTRSVKLTNQSTHFLSIAERLLDDLERAITDMHEQVNLHAGSVVVCGATSFLSYVLTPAIKFLASTYPGVRVRLQEAGTAAVISDVVTDKADFGITTLWGKEPQLDAIKLISDRVGVVCNTNHAFAKRSTPITLKELEKQIFIGLSRQNGLKQVIDRENQLPEICRKPSYEVSVVHLLKPLISDDVGIALLPAMAAKAITDKKIVYIPLKTSIWRHVHFVTRRGRSLSPAAERLKQLVFDQLIRYKGDATIQIGLDQHQLMTQTEAPSIKIKMN